MGDVCGRADIVTVGGDGGGLSQMAKGRVFLIELCVMRDVDLYFQ